MELKSGFSVASSTPHSCWKIHVAQEVQYIPLSIEKRCVPILVYTVEFFSVSSQKPNWILLAVGRGVARNVSVGWPG